MADHINVTSKKPAHGDVHHQEGDAAYLRAHVKGVRLVDGDGGEGEGADEQQHMGEDHEEVDEDVRIHHEDVPADAADQAAQLADDARAGEEDKADLGPALKKRVKNLQFFLLKERKFTLIVFSSVGVSSARAWPRSLLNSLLLTMSMTMSA